MAHAAGFLHHPLRAVICPHHTCHLSPRPTGPIVVTMALIGLLLGGGGLLAYQRYDAKKKGEQVRLQHGGAALVPEGGGVETAAVVGGG